MKDELMNVKIKFTEQSQTVAELKQEISRLETKVPRNRKRSSTYIPKKINTDYFEEMRCCMEIDGNCFNEYTYA